MRDLINLIEQLDEITVSSTDEFLDKIVNPDLAHVIMV